MPSREVHCADAIPWLRARGRVPGTSVVTSLPDVSELGVTLPVWRAWFLEAARLCLDAASDDSVAIFFQTDIKRDGVWIDKGAWVVRAVEDAGGRVLFHKIVARRTPGQLTYGRPGYTHLIATSRAATAPDVTALPDIVVDAGRQRWVRAMGVKAAGAALRFVRDHTNTTLVLDPFCGVGTVLAAANALGLDALGVEKNKKRSERARALAVPPTELGEEDPADSSLPRELQRSR